jgi:DNA repair exonuclease SbcCD nuclease subunit
VKLAHIADSHLGIRQYHRQTSSGINQREADVAQAFRLAIDGVIEARPDIVVFAGDLFHSVRPTNAAIVFAFRQAQRLREALPASPIVLIAGNHDTPRSVETGSILRLFEELGVDVAAEDARRLVYPQLDLSVLAVPHQVMRAADRPLLRPEGSEKYRLLVLHTEVEGEYPIGRGSAEYGGPVISKSELHLEDWSYVALGHYHTQHQVDRRAWYSGSLEYVGPNLWGELADDTAHGSHGKGWLLVDLDTGRAERRGIPSARRVLDLEPVQAEGKSATVIDELIARRLAAVHGGITNKIIRLRVFDIPRHVARELNHAAIREFKSEALHCHIDLRRPDVRRISGMGAPGRRQTLPELVTSYLRGRPLPAELDREAFVRLGQDLMETVEREMVGG